MDYKGVQGVTNKCLEYEQVISTFGLNIFKWPQKCISDNFIFVLCFIALIEEKCFNFFSIFVLVLRSNNYLFSSKYSYPVEIKREINVTFPLTLFSGLTSK